MRHTPPDLMKLKRHQNIPTEVTCLVTTTCSWTPALPLQQVELYTCICTNTLKSTDCHLSQEKLLNPYVFNLTSAEDHFRFHGKRSVKVTFRNRSGENKGGCAGTPNYEIRENHTKKQNVIKMPSFQKFSPLKFSYFLYFSNLPTMSKAGAK